LSAPYQNSQFSAVKKYRTLGFLLVLIMGMGVLSYASVPLYKLFCQVTGYGGTTQQVTSPSSQILERKIKIRFDANTKPTLDWNFQPVQTSMDISVGQNALAFYQAENTGKDPVVGTATFNVTPEKAGVYFNKIDCFCFVEQLLAPQEAVEMPVSFFIDPDIVNDPNLDDVTTITLSYTFFPSEDQSLVGKTKKENAS
jgi:cytochrome c oxidase assembly protein subunit 11|tara:strand:- start:1124 stop:1717 length:594 start_codon:yes stop_codon:yes gene_type:complete